MATLTRATSGELFCDQCAQAISEDAPVYMRHGRCHCSKACRRNSSVCEDSPFSRNEYGGVEPLSSAPLPAGARLWSRKKSFANLSAMSDAPDTTDDAPETELPPSPPLRVGVFVGHGGDACSRVMEESAPEVAGPLAFQDSFSEEPHVDSFDFQDSHRAEPSADSNRSDVIHIIERNDHEEELPCWPSGDLGAMWQQIKGLVINRFTDTTSEVEAKREPRNLCEPCTVCEDDRVELVDALGEEGRCEKLVARRWSTASTSCPVSRDASQCSVASTEVSVAATATESDIFDLDSPVWDPL